MKATSESGALTHQEVQDLLPSYIGKRLPEERLGPLRAHLAACEACRADLALETRLRADPQREPAGLDPQRAFARLAARLPEQPRPVPGPLRLLRQRFSGGAGWMPYALAGQGVLLVVLAVRLIGAAPAPAQFHALSNGAAPARASLVLMFKPDASSLQIERALRDGNVRIVDGPTVTGAYLLQASGDEAVTLRSLRANPAVKLAESLDAQP